MPEDAIQLDDDPDVNVCDECCDRDVSIYETKQGSFICADCLRAGKRELAPPCHGTSMTAEPIVRRRDAYDPEFAEKMRALARKGGML
ncbi:hypothetical protein [Falsiroseomonas sp.]|uniref:hypothetical protein n=1 Tax=Falsiroseomonas sp. TaxID=2870721 RepID=UPI003F71332C